jgi:hypothetical protein
VRFDRADSPDVGTLKLPSRRRDDNRRKRQTHRLKKWGRQLQPSAQKGPKKPLHLAPFVCSIICPTFCVSASASTVGYFCRFPKRWTCSIADAFGGAHQVRLSALFPFAVTHAFVGRCATAARLGEDNSALIRFGQFIEHSTYAENIGADGGGRTHTLLRVPDFESSASANSATSAHRSMAAARRFTVAANRPGASAVLGSLESGRIPLFRSGSKAAQGWRAPKPCGIAEPLRRCLVFAKPSTLDPQLSTP